jgi:DNA-binding transcriptional LysR family regulator
MRPELELRHLWYFVAVAEALSFSRAAERVGIAQPPLSQQIQKLEGLVGCALFDRSGRRVRLTEAGARLVPEARRLLADAAQTTATLRQLGRGELGTLQVGFAPSTLFSPLPAAVRRFRERFPGVRVRLQEIFPPEVPEALRAGRLDVALLREPAPEDGLATLPVLVERFVAGVPTDHPLAGRTSIPVGALRDEPFVLFPRAIAPGQYRRIQALCRVARFEPRVVQEAEEWHTIISLVEAGMGVSLIPPSFQGRRAGGLRYIALTGKPVHTTTAACFLAAGRSRIADAFLEVLAAARGER